MTGVLRLAGYLWALSYLSLACVTSTPTPTRTPRATQPEPGGPRSEAGSGHTRPVSEREGAQIAELTRSAERVRGLRFVRSVPVWVQDRDAIMGYARGQFDRDRLERATALYTALGLLPAGLDVRDLLERLLGEQIIGYYDDKTGGLFVRDEVMRAFESTELEPAIDLREARMTLVHELVHALQDQHLGLSSRLARPMDTDSENAFKALYEGDAMLAMMAFSRLGQASEPPNSVRRTPLAQDELASAPAIVRVPLLAAYLDGLAFAANLFAQGGWASVDGAYRDPPSSTEQILHSSVSGAALAPERPRIPDAPSALGADYELWFDDTLGELELSVYFGLGMSEAAGRQAAAGWGGDRIYVYRRRGAAQPGEQLALLWLTSWDSDADASEAQRAAERALLRAGRRGNASVDRSGLRVLVAIGVPSGVRAAVQADFPRWPRH